MSSPTIDVVIPVYGGWEHTERCLASLAAQTVPHTPLVVDNASPDDTLARVREAFPDVRVIEMGANAGFARAVNRGIAAGSAELVVVLNNDVTCEPDFLEQTARAFAAPRVGSVAPLLLQPGGERIDGFGIAVDATLAGFVRLQGRPVSASTTPDDDATLPLLGPYGAAGAYRRAALDVVGGLDERIFMYGEELDLALRLRAAGWDAATAPDARAVHEGSATSSKRSARQRGLGGFGRGYLLRRYGVLRTRMAPRALLTELIAVAGDVVISRDAAALRGRVAGWRAGRDLPRHAIPRQARESPLGFVASLRERVIDYDGST